MTIATLGSAIALKIRTQEKQETMMNVDEDRSMKKIAYLIYIFGLKCFLKLFKSLCSETNFQKLKIEILPFTSLLHETGYFRINITSSFRSHSFNV